MVKSNGALNFFVQKGHSLPEGLGYSVAFLLGGPAGWMGAEESNEETAYSKAPPTSVAHAGRAPRVERP